jgi:hypothetical protein
VPQSDIIGPVDPNSPCKTNIQTYISGAFDLAIAIAAILSFVMLVYGGFKYTTTDSLGEKSSSRDTIENAIAGLLLAIGAYVILYTINPQILDFKLTTPGLPDYGKISYSDPSLAGEGSGGPVVPWYPLSDEKIKESNNNKDYLYNKGIGTNAGPCTKTGQTTGCTNLNDLPKNAIDGLIALRNGTGIKGEKCTSANCDLFLSGGTEGGHVSHGPNKSVVDLSFNAPNGNYNRDLAQFIIDNGGTPVQYKSGLLYTVNVNGVNATFLKESDHWHVVFK